MRRRRGFTLLELVIVVGVLVILTGLVLPNLDVFKQKANKGVSAANMADLSRVIQQFYAQNCVYPDRWDSLMNSTGTALWAATYDANHNLQPGLDSELTGGPIPGSPTKLTTTTISSDGYLRSLTRMGITTVLDQGDKSSSDFATDRFVTPRALANGGTVATVNPADDDGKAIIAHLYPQSTDGSGNPVVPAGKMLVVVGIGPTNTMMGKAVQEVPSYPNRDVTVEYGRFLAVFEASDGGSPACLKTVLGADGDTIGSETAEYYQK
ncbi:MAG: prepilin-type N-terminal cleavage/methylation domain-containing protein [Planctomycetota bacterium]|nr:prepilin-type N-terminal cleavage/methylation domain-containing protein [Planctomycetota bacterium]